MPVLGLNHINFHGDRALLDRMRDFYCDAVGLVEGPRPAFRMFGYWLYAGDQPIIHLYEAMEGEVRDLNAINSFDHFAFSATDAAGTEARLAALGIPYTLKTLPAMAVKQIFIDDPAGNRVELQFPSED